MTLKTTMEGRLTVDGATIRYKIAGQGPPLILQAPGWGIGSGYLETLARLEKKHTVVTYDPRGSGGSRGAPVASMNVGRFVADLEALRKALGIDRFALMGHSHGGLIALHYAARYPERVTRLIALDAQLIGVGCTADTPFMDELRKDPVYAAAAAEMDRVGWWGHLATLQDDASFTRFMQKIGAIYFRKTEYAPLLAAGFEEAQVSLDVVRGVSARDHEYPVGPIGPRLTMPTLVVTGAYDAVCPPGAAEVFAKALPRGELAWFDGSGHFPWLEEADRFFAKVEAFLAQG